MDFKYDCVRVQQKTGVPGAPECVLFAAPVGEILQWAEVDRAETQDGGGVQRRQSPAKTNAIARFLEQDNRNTIPAAITVALFEPTFADDSPGASVTVGRARKSLVIDGQHRLYGVAEYDKSMPLNVVGIVDPDDLEIAFQFLVVNNKSTRVPTDHIRLLSLKYNDEELRDRLATARINLDSTAPYVGVVDRDHSSPFFHSVIWPVDTREGDRRDLVRPASIELALNYASRKDLPGLETDDALIGFFFALWDSIRSKWGELWVEESKLLSKAGLVAMTMFLVDDMTPLIDRGDVDAGDPEMVFSEVGKILDGLRPEFWLAEWDLKGLDTQTGRALIVEALQKMRRNLLREQPWEQGIRLFG